MAIGAQVHADTEALVVAWNDRQAKRMPLLFAPTIGRCHSRALLVPVGTLSSVPNHQCDPICRRSIVTATRP